MSRKAVVDQTNIDDASRSRSTTHGGWFGLEQNEPSGATTYLGAVRAALHDELSSDPSVVLLGEDIGVMGGAFRVTEGLMEAFGEDRVIDTPLAETAIVGAGIGLAIMGMRPIVELQFADFISCAYDQLVTEAAKLHYRFGVSVPLVVRAPSGGGIGAGPFHSQSPEGIFARIPGLKVVCPGTVEDAYSLLRWAVRDPNPVIYFEHKALYRSLRGELVADATPMDSVEPLIRRPGRDVTLVTYGSMLTKCLSAASQLSYLDIEVEVIDLRVLAPLEVGPIRASVNRTGRLVIVHEDSLISGIGSEVAAAVAADAIWSLDAPIRHVAAPNTPIPAATPLEDAYLPSVPQIVSVVRELAVV